MSIFSILNVGHQGISSSQRGLLTTGNNISNVNTKGYSRQETVQEPISNLRGVRVADIRRMRDHFLDARKEQAMNLFGFQKLKAQKMGRIERILDETNQPGIGAAFSGFFKSLQDLTVNPGGSSERASLRSQATNMTQVIRGVYNQLNEEHKAADAQVTQLVDEINIILQDIASLNDEITQNFGSSNSMNELLDRRQQMVHELQQKLPVHVLNDSNIEITSDFAIFGASGMPLIQGTTHNRLEVKADQFNDGFHEVVIVDSSGTEQNITGALGSGELGAALQMRDQIIPDQKRWIDRLTAEFVTQFNLQHRAGTDLDGDTNIDFFAPLTVSAKPLQGNSLSGGVSSASVVDQSQLTMLDYEIEFTAANSFDVYEIQSDGSRSLISAGNAYASPTTVTFAGIEVTLNGAPAAGDVFQVNTLDGVSENIALSADIQASARNIAAGFSDAPGDNENALLLAALEDAPIVQSATVKDFINARNSEIGMMTQRANSDFETEDFTLKQIDSFIEEVSGVSLDEESTNLIRYQRAYQAAAKVITSVDEVMQSLLAILR